MAKGKPFAESIADLSSEDADREYRRLLHSRNSLKEHNDRLSKWLTRTTDAINILSTKGSVVFQYMAELAGVRNHPSVTQAVEAFSSISHPQWEAKKVEFPDDWKLEGATNEGSGDADMALNSWLANVFDITAPWEQIKLDADQVAKFFIEARKVINEIHLKSGFKPKQVCLKKDDLSGVGWRLLDIAQQMDFARHMLRHDLRAAAYRQIEEDLYEIVWANPESDVPNFSITYFGEPEEAF